MNLGQFIKERRIAKQMTQEDLASQIGKNKNFISRLENNKVNSLKDYMIEPLAEALDVPIWALFDGFNSDGSKVEYKQLTPDEFANEVKILLSKTKNMSEQKKQYVVNTVNFICKNDKK